MFLKGDRVRVVKEPVDGREHPWNGQTGAVVRVPGEEATPGAGPSGSYALSFDGREGHFAPFWEHELRAQT